MKKKILLLGCGGHANSCIDLILSSTNYKQIQLLSHTKENVGKKKLSFAIIDIFNFTKKITASDYLVVNGIGQIKDYKKRRLIFFKFKSLGFKFLNLISKNSYVSKLSFLNEGVQVFHGAIINANVVIGSNCIINSHSLIEHDVRVGNNVHISTGVKINGSVQIKDNTFIGSGAIIIDKVRIGSNVIIGAGAVIKKNICDNKIVK